MPEASGGAACLVNPFDVADIRRAIRRVIEDGAYFKGSIDIVKPEPRKSSASWQPNPQVMLVAATPANSQSAAML